VAQLDPFASAVQVVVLDPGWQLWHALEGLAAPDACTVPAMTH
jgi:hypothetical protein